MTYMRIIKEWQSRTGGIVARFYFCDGHYFIDYDGCRQTAEVTDPASFAMWEKEGVPKRYLQYAFKYMFK